MDPSYDYLSTEKLSETSEDDLEIIEVKSDVVPITKKLYVTIVGDSILSGLSEKAMSKNFNVKVRNYGECTSEDLKDRIQSIIGTGADIIVVHIGTNDITKDVDTIPNLTTIVRSIRRKLPDSKIAISSIIGRKDKSNIEKEVAKLNMEIREFTEDYSVDLISNENIDESSLGSKKLHLNKKGNSCLAVNFMKYINKQIS